MDRSRLVLEKEESDLNKARHVPELSEQLEQMTQRLEEVEQLAALLRKQVDGSPRAPQPNHCRSLKPGLDLCRVH